MGLDFDVDAFLRKPLIAHLATASIEGPRESPVWFLWEGDRLWLIGSDRDSFPKRIREEPRCAVGIVDFNVSSGELRHVGVRGLGTVEALDQPRMVRLLTRYLGPDPTTWNERFREAVIDRLTLMVCIVPVSIVARDQSYFANISPLAAKSPHR